MVSEGSKKRIRSIVYMAAALVGWPLTVATALAIPGFIVQVSAHWQIPGTWTAMVLLMLCLPQPYGMSIAGVALAFACAALFMERKSRSVLRARLSMLFAAVAFLCLTYGVWVRTTGFLDDMF